MFNPLSMLGFGDNDSKKTTRDDATSNDCPESTSGHDFVFQTSYDKYADADDEFFDGGGEYTKTKTAMFECEHCGEVDLRRGQEEHVDGETVSDKFGTDAL